MSKKVAIIDDDEIFQFTTKIKFEKLGLVEDVMIFNDGEEAMQFIQSGNKEDMPEILLLDINMPIVDGWDFLELFEKVPKEKKQMMEILMLSSSINPDDVKRAEANAYVADYITKPISDADVKKIFRQ
ncbi:MAG: CheY-like chemotaxis protein [Bacteroidia bacterium]|jgi:CheY-like chemotaxis protein|tara:strand:+ start:1108 stop:1491 length:384 start_codon:yes stop_codon:yes gene_type:complete